MRKLLSLILIVLSTLKGFSQDPHFSQFFVSPLTLNPALTGKFNGDFRISGNYRDQWPEISKAYVTTTLAFDAPILRNRISESDTWGVGVIAMSDKTASGVLTSNYLSLTTAYHKGLDENGYHSLGLGFQAIYADKRLDGTKLNFLDELDANGGFTGVSMETIDNQVLKVNHFSMGLGFLYNGSTNGYNNFYAGLSAYHLNRSNESFTGDIFYKMNPRYTFNMGGAFPLRDETKTVYGSALYSTQAGAENIVIGGAMGFSFNSDPEFPTAIYLGAWTRFNNVNDALIPYVGLEYGGIRFGASYDINISSLKTASQSKGGVEISLIFIKRPPGQKFVPCPKF